MSLIQMMKIYLQGLFMRQVGDMSCRVLCLTTPFVRYIKGVVGTQHPTRKEEEFCFI